MPMPPYLYLKTDVGSGGIDDDVQGDEGDESDRNGTVGGSVMRCCAEQGWRPPPQGRTINVTFGCHQTSPSHVHYASLLLDCSSWSGCESTAMCIPPAGQMTIFYNGKVNVYGGVPVDKARMIMQIAGSPNCPTHDTKCRPISCRLPSELPTVSPTVQPLTGKPVQHAQESKEEGKISREPGAEGPTGRKASLQRYLEKKKDRGRFKNNKKIGTSSSSSLEMYINQAQIRNQTSNGQLSRSGTCSPTQPKRCSSIENLPKNLRLCVDLNGEGPEDES